MTRPKPAVRARYALALASALAAVGLVVWFQQQGRHGALKPASSDPFAGMDLLDPESSFLVLRHACETGGNERTREVAIAWLDQQVRRNLPLSPSQEDWLLTMLERNGHASWDPEYRFWIFNSAFNTLHMASQQERFSRLLESLALNAPEKTMRLYALQHIAAQRSIGHLTGPLADKVRATLQTLASQPGSPVAGTALSDLIAWDGRESPPSPELVALALKLAAEPACEVDIRVTALHAAREASLPLARELAPDTSQTVLLRKAAIALIGQHGDASDRVALEALVSENFRIAQAAEPALRAIHHRLTHPDATVLVPF